MVEPNFYVRSHAGFYKGKWSSNYVYIKIINLALSWTVERKELSRSHMTHDKVHAVLTNQGSKEEGTTATANCIFTRAVVQPCCSSNCFPPNGRHRHGGNSGNQKMKEEDQGWFLFGDSKNDTIQYGSETDCLLPYPRARMGSFHLLSGTFASTV